MKLLIVDDAPKKYQRLIATLEKDGIPPEEVIVATSAEAARKHLKTTQFDLMVLDILLPFREYDEEDYGNSIDLLTELAESTELVRPIRIVGITADPKAATRASPMFTEHLWTLIPYVESNDEWLTQIRNCAVYQRDLGQQETKPDYGIDLVVICALAEPELREVLNLPWNFAAARPLDEHLFVHEGSFVSGGKTLRVAALSCARMGLVSAALTTSRAIRLLRPRLITMTGICAGISGKVSLGDVIFVDPAWDWQSGKYLREADKEAEFLISPHQVGPTASARSFAEQLKTERSLLSGIADAAPDKAPNVLRLAIGPMAAGAAVVADADVVSEVKAQHRDVAGIEMETYGFFVAAETASSPRPIPTAFKSACDFADALKNDKLQRYAAYASARVMQAFMEKFGHALIDGVAP